MCATVTWPVIMFKTFGDKLDGEDRASCSAHVTEKPPKACLALGSY